MNIKATMMINGVAVKTIIRTNRRQARLSLLDTQELTDGFRTGIVKIKYEVVS